jgi:tRNA(Ile)-lysidine synthase
VQARFERHLADRKLLGSADRILVGYSGGADSTCLLDLLVRAGVEVVAGHLHHGQREEADREQALCSAFAESLNIPFMAGRADVPRMSSDLGIGLEEAGREARYAFFRQAAFASRCNLIATAHTRTDAIESLLLNLSRGCGLHGLSGIPERRENIVRPLLPFSREETREYCIERGLWFHDDPANADMNFSRARIRHRVLPELQALNPALDSALARLMQVAHEEDRFLNGMAAAALEGVEIELDGPLRFLSQDAEVRFRRDGLTALPAVLFKRAIRLAAEAMGAGLSFEQTQALVEGVAHQERGSITAEGGEVAVSWTDEWIEVRNLVPDSPFRYPLTVPGETESEEFGWKFVANPAGAPHARATRAAMEVEIALEATRGALYFRTVQPGDTMRPLGFDGRRKLSDLLSEAHLTETARRRLPIVCDLVGPLWAPGVCLDERVRPLPDRPVLQLRFTAIGEADGT